MTDNAIRIALEPGVTLIVTAARVERSRTPVAPRSIAEARKELKMSQEDLAEAAGCSRVYVSQIERGATHNVSLDIARRLARALGGTLDEFFSEQPLNT